jgi:hypothetical protein
MMPAVTKIAAAATPAIVIIPRLCIALSAAVQNVCLWPKADILMEARNVRFRG